ncbi:MAG: hypothetical protein QF464_05835, partial [Myxococcota bacterium]|nr:hypothetical protein [Myxococcota bacterium]
MATSVAPTATAAPGAVPWSVGEEIGAGWTLDRVQRHPEFVRLRLTHGDTVAAIEVAPGQPGDAWSTTHYRVQPQP